MPLQDPTISAPSDSLNGISSSIAVRSSVKSREKSVPVPPRQRERFDLVVIDRWRWRSMKPGSSI